MIGVVLSGMLSDGVAGSIAIRRCGGELVVQAVGSALGWQLPANVREHVDVDHVAEIAGIPDLLVSLAGEEHKGKPTFEVPEELRKEVEITMQKIPPNEKLDLVRQLGTPSDLTCPDCGGALWRIEDSVLRYRCHVGHAYVAEALAEGQEQSVESSLWSAVRALEEQAMTARQMAMFERSKEEEEMARKYDKRAELSETQARTLNQVILESKPHESKGTKPREG